MRRKTVSIYFTTEVEEDVDLEDIFAQIETQDLMDELTDRDGEVYNVDNIFKRYYFDLDFQKKFKERFNIERESMGL